MKQKNDLLLALLANQIAIAKALHIELPQTKYVCTKQTKPHGNPVDFLPLELRSKLTNEKAFRNAFNGEKPLLFIKEGKIWFNIRKKNLKAYFLGRLFSGDFSEELLGETIWQDGGEDFPFTEISDVFVVDYIVLKSRINNISKKAPRGYCLIDKCFDEN